MSVDLFLADVSTGAVIRKLATTATDAELESLQSVQSAGSWDAAGARFVFPAVRQGKAVLTIVNPFSGRTLDEIAFPDLGAVMTPAFSPQGDAVAFAALRGGLSDIFVYDLTTKTRRQLTSDPVHGPSTLLVTWRHDTRLRDRQVHHRSRGPGLWRAPAGGSRRCHRSASAPLPALTHGKQINPAWTGDGRACCSSRMRAA